MRKPIKVFKGNDRAMVRKLKAALESVSKIDQRRSAAGERENYEPALFARTVGLTNKVRDLVTRCDEALVQVY